MAAPVTFQCFTGVTEKVRKCMKKKEIIRESERLVLFSVFFSHFATS